MNKASICTAIKAQIPSDKIRNSCSSEVGLKRTAKASSIAAHSTTKSKHIKKAALTLRGKSAKFFKNKISDTIFNGSMWDYVDVFLRIASDYVLLGTTFMAVFLLTAPEFITLLMNH